MDKYLKENNTIYHEIIYAPLIFYNDETKKKQKNENLDCLKKLYIKSSTPST